MDALALRRQLAAQIPARYSPLRHVAGSVAFSVLGSVAALATLSRVAPAEWLVLPASLVACNLIEYAGHRWFMHRPTRLLPYAFEAHTLRHHRVFDRGALAIESPRDIALILFAPKDVFFFSLTTVPGLALVALFSSPNALALAVTGVLLHYFFYELAHLVSHLPPGHWLARRRALAGFRRRHALHHGAPGTNYNVTLPVGDWLLGTRHPDADEP